MSEHIFLVPLFKYEIATAFEMERTEFWRKTKDLKIPKGKVIPLDAVRICKKLKRNIKLLEIYIEENDIGNHKK